MALRQRGDAAERHGGRTRKPASRVSRHRALCGSVCAMPTTPASPGTRSCPTQCMRSAPPLVATASPASLPGTAHLHTMPAAHIGARVPNYIRDRRPEHALSGSSGAAVKVTAEGDSGACTDGTGANLMHSSHACAVGRCVSAPPVRVHAAWMMWHDSCRREAAGGNACPPCRGAPSRPPV